jgi:WD40 repeat protein
MHSFANRYLATTSSDKTTKIWNVEDNFSLDKTLVGHQRWVWDCAFSADSAYLVTGKSTQNHNHPKTITLRPNQLMIISSHPHLLP